MKDDPYYTVSISVEVPLALVAWLRRRLGISEARARVMVRRALRTRAFLLTHSAEVIDAQDEDPLLVFVSNWERAPRNGEHWFDIGTRKGRRMVDGRILDDDEEGSDGSENK